MPVPVHMVSVRETTGRFERPPTPRSPMMAAAFGGNGAKAVMHHPQPDEHVRPALHYVHKPLHSPSASDLPAGYNKRVASKSDPTILHHHEYVPKPRMPPPLAMHQHALKQFVSELASVTQHAGLVGTAAHVVAAQAVYGTVAASSRRPPRMPKSASSSSLPKRGMLVGKPRPTQQAVAAWSPRTPRYTPPVPSHVVDGAASARQRALRRSHSFDYVRHNKQRAGSTSRAPSSARAERVTATMSRSASTSNGAGWKLRRFDQAESRVFGGPATAGMQTNF